MSAPNILLVDDHAMFRTGLGLVIQAALPHASLHEAGSVEQAMSLSQTRMDLVLLDIQLNGLSGLECIALVKRKWPDVPVLVLSSHTDPQSMRLALSRGACDFVSKANSAERIVQAVHAVLHNPQGSSRPAALPAATRGLTPRQCEVIDLLHQGLANKVIARHLGLSDNTVRRHVQDILEFFQVGSRAEAVFLARKQGLVD